ncbi:hypothetical protein CTA1_5149 [Colletotrichum tanaceti]|uniref:Protein kinase domain-containing protein n=1 Tax=Colletotrichum tanaceti TaxID=1306861 RepID=A0A4U6XK58_9PEZI|nr:hypothetical protein CTA1_5149 [Colletotrichum tanaceti]
MISLDGRYMKLKTTATSLYKLITDKPSIGIIWGDVKAENVLIDSDDNAWIIDFRGNYTYG